MYNNKSISKLTNILQDNALAIQVCKAFEAEQTSNNEIIYKIESISPSFKYYAAQTTLAKCNNNLLAKWIKDYRSEVALSLTQKIEGKIDIEKFTILHNKMQTVKTEDGGHTFVASLDSLTTEEFLEYQGYSTTLELLESELWQLPYELLQKICE